MPAGTRIRDNNVFGTTTDNPLTIGAAVMNSTELSLLSTVVAGDHAIITLDPLRVFGAPEIIVVTAHTVGASSATITRAAYGTVARAHPLGTQWVHAPVTEDVTKIVTSGTRPTDPYRGQKIFETDTNRYIGRTTADTWQQEGLFFDPPACRVTNSIAIATVDNVEKLLTFDTERFDTDSMHSTVSATDRITFNTPGVYSVRLDFEFPTNGTGYRYGIIRLGGVTPIAFESKTASSVITGVGFSIGTIYKFAAGDFVSASVFQNSGGALNINKSGNFSPEFSACWIGRGN